MNKLIEKFNNLDKSIKRTIIGGVIIVIILIIVVFIIGTLNNKQLSYSRLENKIEEAAISYYEDHSNKLPSLEGEQVQISAKELVKAEYLKELSEYNDDKCQASIFVQNNGGEYIYRTYLTCKNYSTTTLATQIVAEEQIVTAGDGLYNYGEEYIYRGENVNNYIEFSGKLWRILRINADGTIRIIEEKSKNKLIWDDRYNIAYDDYSGINDYSVSRIKDSLTEYGNDSDNIKTELKKWIVAKNICIDKKDNINFSDLKCSNYSSDKYQFSLPELEDYFLASIDHNCNSITSSSCTNYNYLATGRYWTITPSAKESNRVYTTGGSTAAVEADRSYTVRVVTNLSSHILYVNGDGSEDNPYKIEE